MSCTEADSRWLRSVAILHVALILSVSCLTSEYNWFRISGGLTRDLDMAAVVGGGTT